MLFGHHGAADPQSPATGGLDQLPCLSASGLRDRGIDEGGAAGSHAHRLGRIPRLLDLVHAPGDVPRLAGFAPEHGAGEHPILREGRVAVGKSQLLAPDLVHLAAGVHRRGQNRHVLHLGAIGAGVHGERAADGAGDATQELEPADAGIAARHGDVDIHRRGAGGDFGAGNPDLGESPAQSDDDAADTAVADDDVRPDTDHRHRHIGRFGREEADEIVQIHRPEHDLGGAADPEPGDA